MKHPVQTGLMNVQLIDLCFLALVPMASFRMGNEKNAQGPVEM